MKEKKYVRWLMACTLSLFILYVFVSILIRICAGNDYTERILDFTFNEVGGKKVDDIKVEDITYEMDRDDLIEIVSIQKTSDGIEVNMLPKKKVRGKVFIEFRLKEKGEIFNTCLLQVTRNGLIVNKGNGNFTNFRMNQLCMTIFTALFTMFLWISFFKSRKDLGYSYHSIFSVGLSIWMTIVSILMMVTYFINITMLSVYDILKNAPMIFVDLSAPVVLIFAILLSVSNFDLIRHERYRFQNVLGILLSFCLVFGIIALFLFEEFFTSGSEFQMDLWMTITNTLYSAYAIFECFLIGAIICGTMSAKNNPAYDKDYIVILGCMIRKDGTLFPLIRGRVDRAIKFYKDQIAANGKKAIFVPSGGKGKNELISEAEAMKRYLLEQGIEESQIMMEDQSVNTRQNMEFSKNLIGEGKKAAFSTTNFHVFRSGIISRQVDFEVEGMGSPTKWYFWPNAFIREVIGMISYKWKSLVLLSIPIVAYITIIRFSF